MFWRAAHEAWVLVSTISRFWWTPPCAIFSTYRPSHKMAGGGWECIWCASKRCILKCEPAPAYRDHSRRSLLAEFLWPMLSYSIWEILDVLQHHVSVVASVSHTSKTIGCWINSPVPVWDYVFFQFWRGNFAFLTYCDLFNRSYKYCSLQWVLL